MNICSNFTLSLTGGFQECRNFGNKKKIIAQILKIKTSSMGKNLTTIQMLVVFIIHNLIRQILIRQILTDCYIKSKACNKFVLALVGQFSQFGNCKIEKKYHKLDTASQIAYQPKSQLTNQLQLRVKYFLESNIKVVQESIWYNLQKMEFHK
ncbi:unnamed protein product [Paramecium sonneborni]|uniref:Uncharacterized protein n=1 Tax=Paramecium sonneborni TaxID=65129 RepID=A0A8S1QQ86_9CILI|nr:unnamed protein product [Paramecium sonneborni]